MAKPKLYEFSIPVYWEVSGNMTIKADSLEDALDKAKEAPLPDDAEYIDGSFEINVECAEIENQALLEIIKIDQTKKENLPLLMNKMKTTKGQAYLEKKLKEA